MYYTNQYDLLWMIFRFCGVNAPAL